MRETRWPAVQFAAAIRQDPMLGRLLWVAEFGDDRVGDRADGGRDHICVEASDLILHRRYHSAAVEDKLKQNRP